MNKGPKIIQISGIKGIFLLGFTAICLCAGFIVFPARVAMCAWNYISSTYYIIPAINIWQGLMLWSMIALGGYLINKKHKTISFAQQLELDDEEMKILMQRIKMQKQAQKLNSMMLKNINVVKQEKQSDNEQKNEQTSNNINEKHL